MSVSTETVWTLLGADLRRYLRRRVPDDHLADDLLQETFVRIHRGLSALNSAERLAPWVYRIARNVLHDHYRGSTKAPVSLEEGTPQPDDERQICACGSSERWMNELIEQLPPGYRDAVRLSELEGLSQHEVADHAGISISAARSRIQRGRRMLKTELERCCKFEFDRRSNLLDVEPRPDRVVCRDCGESVRD
jgi:RNA polymerase sigma-70 factor (ECF subfamily)